MAASIVNVEKLPEEEDEDDDDNEDDDDGDDGDEFSLEVDEEPAFGQSTKVGAGGGKGADKVKFGGHGLVSLIRSTRVTGPGDFGGDPKVTTARNPPYESL